MLWFTLLACGTSPKDSVDDTDLADQDTGDAVDPLDLAPPVSFAPDALVDVRVTMDPEHFDALRHETRLLSDTLLGAECLDGPFTSPFTWYEADIEVDGTFVERVGVRKKGFLGSLDETRPSLKVKTDLYVDGQDIGDTERITLNNGAQDPSRMRACLAYRYFRDAGVPAPRCNLAVVAVNGEDLGVYAHVEAVKKSFLRDAFGSDTGHLYEGTLSDFRGDGWLTTFEAKTDETDATGAPLQAIADALAAPDAELVAALEPVVDLDAFVRFWVAEIVVAHWDGYASNTNNFYVYVDPSDGRARFVPWGADQVFYEAADEPAEYVALGGELARRLYALPEMRQAYADEMQRQLDEVFDGAAMAARVDAWEALLEGRYLEPDAASDDRVGLRAFLAGREAGLQAALDAGLPAIDAPPRDPLCFAPVGTLSWTFDTTWTDDFSVPTTTGAFTAVVDGVTWEAPAGSLSVTGYGDEGEAVVSTIGWTDGLVLQVIAAAQPDDFAPGTLALELGDTFATFAIVEEQTEQALFQGFVVGDLQLDAASVSPGAPVSGSASGELFTLPF